MAGHDESATRLHLSRCGICESCQREVPWELNACPGCGKTFDPDGLVPVLVTADAQLMPLLKSALEVAEVPFVVQGGAGLALFPLGPLATGLTRNLVAATILVPRGHAPAAVDVLAGLSEEEMAELYGDDTEDDTEDDLESEA